MRGRDAGHVREYEQRRRQEKQPKSINALNYLKHMMSSQPGATREERPKGRRQRGRLFATGNRYYLHEAILVGKKITLTPVMGFSAASLKRT